jgi:SAM-dependent methyltransferase
MRAVSGNDPKQLVRRGYDALSYRYRADDAEDGNYGPWLAVLGARIPDGAAVLDLGCGNGIPVARHLAAAGHSVTGVDSSQVQIRRARRLVPAASFLRADITKLTLPAATFDAVVCLYTLIHLPLEEQPPLLGRIAGWLRSGGWLLATTGHRGLDRRRGRLARWHGAHVVEPRRRSYLPGVAAGGRPADHRRAIRSRRRRRSRPVLGPPTLTRPGPHRGHDWLLPGLMTAG